MALSLAAAAQPLRLPAPLLIKDLFKPGIRAEIWTVKGETLWLDGIRLSTPTDFDTLRSDDPIARFSALTALPGGSTFFGQIQKFVVNPMTTTYLGSNPQEMEFYRLGDPRTAVPPPPDWRHAIGQIPPWRRAAPVPTLSGLPFLNHAVCCWTGRAGEDAKDLGVYLFRQSFRLERPDTIARATLRLATNVDLLEVAFNEKPLHLAGAQKLAIGEFEVTPMVQAGDNIVALKVRGSSGVISANFGLAFHLEIVRRKDALPAPPLDPTSALLLGRNGDRVWGSILDLSGERVLLATRYGSYTTSWEDCEGLLFPGGWHPARPNPSLKEKLFPNAPLPPTPDLQLVGLPLATRPRPLENCMLLTEGRVTTAKPAHALGDKLFFEGGEGQRFSMPMAEVLAIYPPRPDQASFKRPPREVAILYCQVATRTGEAFHGLLRQISPETVVVETEGGQMMRIKSDSVATIQFPYHSATLRPDEAQRGPVALLAQVSDGENFRTVYEEDSLSLQRAAFIIGADFKLLTLESAAGPESLSPGRYPVVVSLDPMGQYLHSYFGNGDAQQALVRYVEGGGVLVALSRGGAFRTALANQGGGKFTPLQARPDLSELLGIRTIGPADPPQAGIVPFDHPPNEGGEFLFERGVQFPAGLGALPRRIELAPMQSAPFYPMTARNGGQGNIVYSLSDARGRFYGPALTLTPRGRGWVVLVDHLLWESSVEGRPFSERALPLLLRWAVAGGGR